MRSRFGHSRRSGFRLAGALCGVILVAVVVGAAGVTRAEEAAAVSLRFDTTASGYDAPFVLALRKGWYKDAGLEVTLGEGNGSATTVQLVGRGQDTFGWADFGTMMKLAASGAPVRAVAIVGQTSPLAIITLEGSPIAQPRDLLGRTLALNPNGASAQIFTALARKYDLDVSRIKMVTASNTSNAPLLLRGKIDAFIGWVTFEAPQVKEIGGAPKNLLFSDFGVNVLNTSIVVGDSYLRSHPAVACKFVTASVKAYEYAAQHVDEAVDALVAMYPSVKRTIAIDQLQMQLTLLHTKNTEGKPVGWIDPRDIGQTQDILTKYAGLAPGKNPADFYSDECFSAQ